MGHRIITQLVDDLTGNDIADGDGETVSFGLDGQNYTIDLTRENADSFRGLFMDYIAVASKDGRKSTRSRGRSTATPNRSAGGFTAKDIREWARKNGHEVPDRGRVPEPVRQAFEAAH